MHIDVAITPKDKQNQKKIAKSKVSVVIDVLRVSSTITTALYNGAEKIYTVSTIKEAFLKKRELKIKGIPEDKILLGGERKGRKVRGFDLGNSPLEYTKDTVLGKILILSSTNGTKAVKMCKDIEIILIGSLLNRKSVAHYILQEGKDVLLFLSGKEGNFSYEDAVGAGSIISEIINISTHKIQLSDTSLMCLDLYTANKKNLLNMLKKCNHGIYLSSIGFTQDLKFCSQQDIYNVIPIKGKGTDFFCKRAFLL